MSADHQSVQSGTGKLSWSKTSLKRCINTDILLNEKLPFLSSSTSIVRLWITGDLRVGMILDRADMR